MIQQGFLTIKWFWEFPVKFFKMNRANLMVRLFFRIEKPVNRIQNLVRVEFLPTLWCGIRDVAPDEKAVSAIYPHLDTCCRDHDLCPLVRSRFLTFCCNHLLYLGFKFACQEKTLFPKHWNFFQHGNFFKVPFQTWLSLQTEAGLFAHLFWDL